MGRCGGAQVKTERRVRARATACPRRRPQDSATSVEVHLTLHITSFFLRRPLEEGEGITRYLLQARASSVCSLLLFTPADRGLAGL